MHHHLFQFQLLYCPTNLLFIDIPLLCHYINLRLSITFCLSSGDIYLSLGISLSCAFETVSKFFCGKFFEILVILSTVLLPIKPPGACDVY